MQLKLRYYLLLSFISTGISAVTVQTPEWVNQVDGVLAQVQIIQQALTQDIALFLQWQQTLEVLFKDFEVREAERNKLFAALREKVNTLQSQLVLAETEKVAQLEEKNKIIQELESQIAALRAETQQEIEKLNKLIAEVNTELEDTRHAYATLIDSNAEKAEALIAQLISIKQAYSNMVDSRTTFLATLDRFVNTTRSYLSNEGAATHELGIELIGGSFLQPQTETPTSTEETNTATSNEEVTSENNESQTAESQEQ